MVDRTPAPPAPPTTGSAGSERTRVPLTGPEAPGALLPGPIPARMLNEYAYCPRLAYLEWVQGEWADNVETEEGRVAHRRVHEPEGSKAEIHKRSIHLTSERLGATAVVDLVESRGGSVRPVDYKRGRRPPGGRPYEPERVQLCLQGLLLREAGYRCDEGILYFVASRNRVRVRFTAALVARTEALLEEMRARFTAEGIPEPLEDSPKCRRCSLVGICLPEEVRFLRRGGKPKKLLADDPARYPLFVQQPGSRVSLDHGCLAITSRNERREARLEEISQLVLMSGSGATAPVIHECCERSIPILHMSGTGWLYGITRGLPHKNIELRQRQFAVAADPEQSLAVARTLVAAKIANSRVLLRRNGDAARSTLAELDAYRRRALAAPSAGELLGIEGTAARLYFGSFGSMLKGAAAMSDAFRFEERNKRPPTDPVNALLSFTYSLLTKDWLTTLYAVGFDPLLGVYHRPRYGKPALALDLMEPFRPVVADSVVVGVINNGEVGESDFFDRMGGILIKPAARKRLISAYERRLATEIRHPLFGYRASYRRIFEIQARLLGRFLCGEIPGYPAFLVR